MNSLKCSFIIALFFLFFIFYIHVHLGTQSVVLILNQTFSHQPILIDEDALRLYKMNPRINLGILKRRILMGSVIKNLNESLNFSNNVYFAYIENNAKKDYVLFKFGNETRAVTRFKTIVSKINYFNISIEVSIPEDIENFLWKWKRGRFFECKKFDIIGRTPTKQIIPLRYIKNMALFRNFLEDHNATGFLMGGTLLGWHRECSIIPHTLDIDFGIFAYEHSNAIIEDLKKSADFQLYWILGMPNNSMELSVYKDHFKIDLFYVYNGAQKNHSYVGGMNPSTRQQMRWNYPIIEEICAGDLLDHLMFVPCNFDKVIKADYGSEWMKDFATSNFSWSSSHKNVERRDIIPESQWKYMFQKFVFW